MPLKSSAYKLRYIIFDLHLHLREREKEMSSLAIFKKPHAICIPYPAQGHINPMLKLAKVLHHKGFYITFLNTEHIHKRLLKSRGPVSLSGLPDFHFETIPDGLPPSDPDTIQDFPVLWESLKTNCLVPFRNLIINKLNNSYNLPPVSCIIYDGVMSFTLDVAQELGIPAVLFWTTSACGFMGYLEFPNLPQEGLIPLKGYGYLDTPIDWIPGLKDIRLRDIPTLNRTCNPFTADENDILNKFMVAELERAPEASAVVLNTFDELEHDVLNAIKTKLPPIYTIGSLNLLVDQISESGLNSIGSNLWKEDPECLDWLDSKEHNWCPQEQVLNHPSIGGFITHSGWNSTLESMCGSVPMICWPFVAEQQMNRRYSCTHWGVGIEIDSNAKRDVVENLVKEVIRGGKGKEMRMKAKEWKKRAEEATAPGGSSYENIDKLVNEILNTTD
ncbi:hypothetical protein AQUCO_01000248v1 [Aquilegia coerulea]|uniref:Glycosyltransferase n=1 Tax=Aquilegia coerulea TaxID=218851 RepID=A0A2G5E901_AQUCA|nr:hypothetical protein AQUCO_01000248v1 [Aquilegia coerulea]